MRPNIIDRITNFVPRGLGPVDEVKAWSLDVPLKRPFAINSANLDHVRNVGVRIRFGSGISGWGEIPTLHPVTRETQATAFEAVKRGADVLLGMKGFPLAIVSSWLDEELHDFPAVRGGLEMAYLDAMSGIHREPLLRFLGAKQNHLETDITIPICSSDEAEALAIGYKERGFSIIKTKVNADQAEGISRLRSIVIGHPQVRLIVDANEAFTADAAIAFLREAGGQGIHIEVFEQPVHRDDWDGMVKVAYEAQRPNDVGSKTLVALDESVRGISIEDRLNVERIKVPHVVNVKIAKSGLVGAILIADTVRRSGSLLMIGGMVESRLGMGGLPRRWPWAWGILRTLI